jgi:hypothetical protein
LICSASPKAANAWQLVYDTDRKEVYVEAGIERISINDALKMDGQGGVGLRGAIVDPVHVVIQIETQKKTRPDRVDRTGTYDRRTIGGMGTPIGDTRPFRGEAPRYPLLAVEPV